MSRIKGCWQLRRSTGLLEKLYTRKCFEFAESRGIEYIRGPYKLFDEDEFPPLVEDNPSFKLYYPDIEHPGQFTLFDCAREIVFK